MREAALGARRTTHVHIHHRDTEAQRGTELDAAKREFTEETGFPIDGEFRALTPLRQPGGKTFYAWAVEGDCDPAEVRSNTFEMEWPPRSGKRSAFPEVDRADWYSLDEARKRIIGGQAPFLDQLVHSLSRAG